MGGAWTQIFPSSPTFTEADLPSLRSKVYIVTGGNTGVGLALVNLLYSKNATVYIASRTPSKITSAISNLQTLHPTSTGTLHPLPLDLSDLSTVGPAVSTFLAQESRLDVLFNNAGIAHVPAGSISKQGHEAHMGTNCLGPFLLTQLLLPILTRTAQAAPKASVRVVFTASSIVDLGGPPGGLRLAELQPGSYSLDKAQNYRASKIGNWFLASEFDKRVRKDGVVCIVQNPGNLTTASWNGIPAWLRVAMKPVMHEPKLGAYTALWAGLSGDVKVEDGGRYGIPWGRWHTAPREDVLAGLQETKDGGTGLAGDFWKWCEVQTRDFTGTPGDAARAPVM